MSRESGAHIAATTTVKQSRCSCIACLHLATCRIHILFVELAVTAYIELAGRVEVVLLLLVGCSGAVQPACVSVWMAGCFPCPVSPHTALFSHCSHLSHSHSQLCRPGFTHLRSPVVQLFAPHCSLLSLDTRPSPPHTSSTLAAALSCHSAHMRRTTPRPTTDASRIVLTISREHRQLITQQEQEHAEAEASRRREEERHRQERQEAKQRDEDDREAKQRGRQKQAELVEELRLETVERKEVESLEEKVRLQDLRRAKEKKVQDDLQAEMSATRAHTMSCTASAALEAVASCSHLCCPSLGLLSLALCVGPWLGCDQ